MLRYLFREIYSSTISWNRSFDRVNVFAKITYTVLMITLAVIIDNILALAPLLLYALTISAITRDTGIAIHSYKAPAIPVIMVSLLTLLFTGDPYQSILIGLRIMVVASAILSFFSSTDPMHLSYLLERLHLPKWIILSTLLVWRLIPLSMRILDEAYGIARLKGDPLWRSLVAATATLYLRSNSMVETLYIYGIEIEELSLKPIVRSYSGVSTAIYVLLNTILIVFSIILFSWC